MSIKATLKQGGEGKWPKVVGTLKAKPGKANALKEKVDKFLDALVEDAPKEERAEAKKALSTTTDGDTVTITIVPPKKEFKKEDAELKAALKEHTPEFTAELKFAKDFADVLKDQNANPVVAIRGIEAKIGAVIADSLIAALSDMPGLPPQAQRMMGLFRSSKARNELHYDDDTVTQMGGTLPPIKHLLPQLCGAFEPGVAKEIGGWGELLEEVQGVLFEGLPYDWQLILEMKSLNPTPLLELCANN